MKKKILIVVRFFWAYSMEYGIHTFTFFLFYLEQAYFSLLSREEIVRLINIYRKGVRSHTSIYTGQGSNQTQPQIQDRGQTRLIHIYRTGVRPDSSTYTGQGSNQTHPYIQDRGQTRHINQ